MYNAFLVIRTVFFGLLTYFHVLILIFASWNITAAKSSGMSAPGASVFLLITSILVFVLVPVAYLAELICARARPAQVRFECMWTVLMSTLQLAASIDVTINGPLNCQADTQWALCVSSSLLIHVSWLATLIILSYCLAIWVTAGTHATFLPDVWSTPVPHVPWFQPHVEPPAPVRTAPRPPTQNKRAKASSIWSSSTRESCAVSKYITERWEKLSGTEHQSGQKERQSADTSRPLWARQQTIQIRRGIDNPFARPLPGRKEPPVVINPPPRTYSKQIVKPRESHLVEEREWQGTTTTRSDSTLVTTPGVFPRRIANPDLPILRPDPSKWVRADAIRTGQ